MTRWQTPATIADDLGVSTRTVLRWIERGHLAAVRLPGGRLRIAQSALSTFLADCSTIPHDGTVVGMEAGRADG